MIDFGRLLDEELDQYLEDSSMVSRTNSVNCVEDAISDLERRRENVINGGVNCIPLPFDRFRIEFPGVEHEQYVVVTANEKVGKTSLADFIYVFETLDYCYNNPDKARVHIIYFTLEESITRVVQRYLSHLLYKLDGLRLSPSDLRSTDADYPVPQHALDLLRSKEYQDRLRFFKECVQFETEDTNPTGILRVCENYAKETGIYRSHKIESKGNAFKEVEVFESYEQSDQNLFNIVIIDHIGLVDKEQGFTSSKQSIDKMSEYFEKYLRNRYKFCCVSVQQQSAEAEGFEAVKQKRMLPSTSTLRDSKYTSSDANVVIGIFDPSRFNIPAWMGYKIQDAEGNGLRGCARFMYMLRNRDGEQGGVCPLFFDGTVCQYEELPRPDQIDEISKYYNRVRNMKSFKQQCKHNALTLSMLAQKIVTKNKNK